MRDPTDIHAGRHVGQIFFQRAAELGPRPFIKLQESERFRDISWQDFAALVRNVALGLFTLGLAPGNTVAIVGENSLPWLAADLATLSAGFTNVVIAPRLSDLMLLRILNHAECRAAFVQDSLAVGRLLNLMGQLPALAHIIVMQENDAHWPNTLSFAALIERGKSADENKLAAILESVHPSDLATIMYTSGSTGELKGVMRTQDNLLTNITNGGAIKVSGPQELAVNVLSVNHLFGRFGFLKSAVTGGTTALIEAAETAVDLAVLQRLAPTCLAVVPRVMEKIWADLLKRDDNGALWSELQGIEQQGSGTQLSDAASQRLDAIRSCLKVNVQRALGGRIQYITYGGAAMPPRIMRFFQGVGIPLIGSYGSTECGGVTLCGIGENRPGSLGRHFANVRLRIAEDGEILVQGPTVSPGYFKDPEATREVFDDAGWYYTGDLGVIDSDGSLRLTGRKKDVFKCSDGSNIYPGFIELLLENEPFVSQAVLLGDGRPFVAALIVPARQRIAAAMQRDSADLSHADIKSALQPQIARINNRLEVYAQIRKFSVLPEEFPTTVRSINPFHKVKIDRRMVAEFYRQEIDAIYQGEPADSGD